MTWKPVTLTAWGRTQTAPCLAARPERIRELVQAAASPGGRTLLARGAGRSYGDQCLNRDGAVILTERLDRVLAFDPESGEVVLEPGVTFRDLLDVFLPRGFIPPTSPGTAFVTMGGAVANDVHGKDHHRVGSFGDHVVWIEMLLPNGQVVRASVSEEPELFRATVGGLGLTGIILTICLRLARIPSGTVRVRTQRISNLDEFLAGFQEASGSYWSVGWIDALARGRSLGRGVLETAEPADIDTDHRLRAGRRVPLDLPGFVLNPLTVRTFNEIYWRRAPARGAERAVPLRRFLYPLDSLYDWNRLYGKRGFHQLQCVLPNAHAPRGVRLILEEVAKTGKASFLAVLKATGPAGLGYLSFPLPGLTLALDFPAGPDVREFLGGLERMVLDHGGRIYLAKDSVVSPEGFRAMYPRLAEFLAVRHAVDPQGSLGSDMARRLGIA